MVHDFEQPSNILAGAAAWAGAWFPPSSQEESLREIHIRLEERCKERTRIARELHDTLLQGFLSASMVLHAAVEGMPADSASKHSLSRALQLMRRVIDEGRSALKGLRLSGASFTSLERALAEVGEGFASGTAGFRISVMGRPKALEPEVQEQVYLIAREALLNALRHSEAASIEAEIEYLPSKLRVVVRDNGCGLDEDLMRHGREAHWGLLGMRERARSIGAKFRVWSRRGTGTEVEICVPSFAGKNTYGVGELRINDVQDPCLTTESAPV